MIEGLIAAGVFAALRRSCHRRHDLLVLADQVPVRPDVDLRVEHRTERVRHLLAHADHDVGVGVARGRTQLRNLGAGDFHGVLEQLDRKLAIVATDLQSGELIVFERGNTGLAVRASSSVPGVFQPVKIAGREFVDGGLVSPVPVKTARDLGADIVVAVDISDKPKTSRLKDSIDVLMQTFTIMGRVIAGKELFFADVVVTPDITGLNSANFDSRNLAIIEGEKAGLEAVVRLKEKIAAYYEAKKASAAQTK